LVSIVTAPFRTSHTDRPGRRGRPPVKWRTHGLKGSPIPGVRGAPDHEAGRETGERETRRYAEISRNGRQTGVGHRRGTQDPKLAATPSDGAADRRLPSVRALRPSTLRQRGQARERKRTDESHGDENYRRSPLDAVVDILGRHGGRTVHAPTRSWSRGRGAATNICRYCGSVWNRTNIRIVFILVAQIWIRIDEYAALLVLAAFVRFPRGAYRPPKGDPWWASLRAVPNALSFRGAPRWFGIEAVDDSPTIWLSGRRPVGGVGPCTREK